MQKVMPFLWFDGQAEEAARFYAEVFRSPAPRDEGGGVTVEVGGTRICAFDGGPQFKFNEAISRALPRLLGDPDRERADRALQAMLKMQKIDVAALEAAAAGA